MQGRLVRLLCVFLQAALRSAAFQVAGLAAELQAFCIHFSRIRSGPTIFVFLFQNGKYTRVPICPVYVCSLFVWTKRAPCGIIRLMIRKAKASSRGNSSMYMMTPL